MSAAVSTSFVQLHPVGIHVVGRALLCLLLRRLGDVDHEVCGKLAAARRQSVGVYPARLQLLHDAQNLGQLRV
jgi:hypothetical protein